MDSLDTLDGNSGRTGRNLPSDSQQPFPFWVVAAAVASAYYVGARFGFALTLGANPISVLWPPNALLMAALLITPSREWPWLILAAFPAHLLAEHESGVPVTMILCWFVSNVTEALIGSYLLRRILREVPRFTSLRSVALFVLCAALAAPFFSSFLDATFVTLVGWGSSTYSELWIHRFSANVLANLTIVPLVLAWTNSRGRDVALTERSWEGALLVVCLACVCAVVFAGALAVRPHIEALLYLPLPFLLWAAIRFGPLGSTTAFAVVVFLTIFGAISGRGPFVAELPTEGALLLQIFLVSVGAPLLFLTAVVTERTRAVEKSTESEERFASILSASPDAVLIFRSSDGAVLDANQRWQELFGAPEASSIASALQDLRDGSAPPGTPSGDGRHDQDKVVEMRTRAGARVQTVWSTSSLRLGRRDCTVAVVRDVTQQRRTEAELREQRNELMHVTRVANLSAMSASLAHELMQPLTAILSNTQAARRILARKPVDYPEISEILDDIVQDDKRAGDVIQRLRVLMKKAEPTFDLLALNDVVQDTLVLSNGELLVQGIAVTSSLSDGLPPVYGDPVQLQQVVLNLLSNASEAMREVPRWRRSLLVATESVDSDSVWLCVADSGPGIPDDLQERIFEPFFSTKQDGLGMGLSICRSIVTEHGGTITAAQNSSRGTTLRVALPAARQAPDSAGYRPR